MKAAEQRPADTVVERTPVETVVAQAIGEIAMPAEIKETYYISKKGDQLVIPRWASSMDSVAVEFPSI